MRGIDGAFEFARYAKNSLYGVLVIRGFTVFASSFIIVVWVACARYVCDVK